MTSSNGGRILISPHGGGGAIWSHDGDELFYRELFKTMAVGITFEGGRLIPGSPELLYEADNLLPFFSMRYSPSPDGERFLVAMNSDSALSGINVVLNWLAELEEIVD